MSPASHGPKVAVQVSGAGGFSEASFALALERPARGRGACVGPGDQRAGRSDRDSHHRCPPGARRERGARAGLSRRPLGASERAGRPGGHGRPDERRGGGLRGHAVPAGPGPRAQGHRAHLRRRPEPGRDAASPQDFGATLYKGEFFRRWHLCRTEAGPGAPGGRRGPCDRLPHLEPSGQPAPAGAGGGATADHAGLRGRGVGPGDRAARGQGSARAVLPVPGAERQPRSDRLAGPAAGRRRRRRPRGRRLEGHRAHGDPGPRDPLCRRVPAAAS